MFTWRYYELGKQFRFDTLIIQKGYFERAISVRADSPIFFVCLNFKRFLVITQIISNMGLHSIKKMYNKCEIL